ncbi:MAG: hypothetical protein M3443_13390 [Actinomycetota bacterium]|nr:hypothetical protein [Actinomycetota bacterium]
MARSRAVVAVAAVAASLVVGAGNASADTPSRGHVVADYGKTSLESTNSAAAAEGGTRFVPTSPVRVLDTRNGTGRPGTAPVGPGQTISVPLADRLPDDAVVVVLNVTGTEATSSTFITAYANGIARPAVSSLNLVAGETRPNGATVYLMPNQTVDFYNNAGNTHLVADLAGYYVPAPAKAVASGAYTPTSPTRMLDTRSQGGAVRGGGVVTIDFTGRVAASATSVTINVTGTDTTGNTFVTAWPTGQARPTASSLNLAPGKTTPNSITVALGTDRKVSFYNNAGDTHLVVDLAGYYATDTGLLFYPTEAVRIFDSRFEEPGALGPGHIVDIYFTDTPEWGALAINMTGTNPSANTYVTTFPSDEAVPNASNLNLAPGQTAANTASAKLGDYEGFRSMGFFNHSGSTDLIIDAFGIFAP